MGAAPGGLDRGDPAPPRELRRSPASRASLVGAFALLGLLAGALWGAADEPRYEARASVVPAARHVSAARLERYAELGASRAVARRAAALLADDAPGGDLLSTVEVAPLPEGGGLSVSAGAAAPDIAAATADAYARALARSAGDGLEPGAEATLPSAPAEDRPALPWALAGLLAGILAGALAAPLLGRRDAAPAPVEPPGPPVDPTPVAPVASPGPATPAPTAAAGGLRSKPPAHGLAADDAARAATGDAPAASATAEFEAVLGAPLLAVLGDPAALLVEAPAGPAVAEQDRDEVRHLAATLGLGRPGAPRVVALIPASAGLDPAPIAVALALAGAELRLRTLLVEAGLGAPALAARLGLDPAPGLLEHLRGEAVPRDVLRGVSGAVEPGRSARVACVPAGAGTSSGEAARLISGEPLAALLGRLGRAYELVVVAGPPLGDGTGAEGLAARAEAVVAVSGERELLEGGPRGAAARLSGVPLRGGILAAGPGGG